MHRMTRAALAAALCSLAVPAMAGAATKTVTAGPALQKPPAGVPRDGSVNQFFPQAVTVHQGDSVKFAFYGFHAVNVVTPGEGAPALALPAPNGLAVSGVNDAAGQPFWFNGQPQMAFNPTLLAGMKSPVTYDGSKDVYSGAPLSDGPPKPFVVTFAKTGTYTYYCGIHPGMKGTVKVVAKGKGIPSPKSDAAHVKGQLAKALAALKKLDKAKAPAGDVITAGPDSKSGEVLYRFTPASKTVKAGTAVTFEMADGTSETHSFTFARDAKTLKDLAKGFIGPLAGSGTPPVIGFDPRAVYPSDAPGTAYDGSNHGNGFFNTGVLDADPRSPLPQKATVTFTKPGTYTYICVIHPEMHGKVVVTS